MSDKEMNSIESEIVDNTEDTKMAKGDNKTNNKSTGEHTIDTDISADGVGKAKDSKVDKKADAKDKTDRAERTDRADKTDRAEKRRQYQRDYKRKQRNAGKPEQEVKKDEVKFKETTKVDTKKVDAPDETVQQKHDYKMFIIIFTVVAVGAILIYFSLRTGDNQITHNGETEKKGWTM